VKTSPLRVKLDYIEIDLILMCWVFQVRIKPQMSKVEMDLVIDNESENYDQDRDEYLQIRLWIHRKASMMCSGAA
jgi:hypothetical protein